MALYNLKSSDSQWRITKFTNDLEVESSYLTSETECACPAGVRPQCRHRQMLPKMLAVGAEDSGMFYDYDKDQFFEPITNEVEEMQPAIISPLEVETMIELPLDSTPEQVAEAFGDLVASAASGSSSLPSSLEPTFKSGELKPDFHPALSGPLKRRI